MKSFKSTGCPLLKSISILCAPRDKERCPGDVTITHIADKNNVSEKSDRPI